MEINDEAYPMLFRYGTPVKSLMFRTETSLIRVKSFFQRADRSLSRGRKNTPGPIVGWIRTVFGDLGCISYAYQEKSEEKRTMFYQQA
jgi:hypothetical protein